MGTINRLLTYLSKKFNTDLHYFLKGGFWLLFTQGTTIVGSLIVTSIFAKLLTENDYGVYRYLLALAVLFTTFSLTGMSQAVLQTSAKGHKEFFPYAMKISLLYNLGTSVSAFIGALYYFMHGNILLALGCVFIAVLQPHISAYQNVVPFLQGLKQFRASANLQVFKVFFITITSLLTIYYTRNIAYLFLSFLLTQTFANALGSLFYSTKFHSENTLNNEIKKKYLRYAQHQSIQSIIIGIASRLDSILVFQQLGAANLALFSIATVIPTQVKGSAKNLVTLLIPKFAKKNTLEENWRNIPKRSLQFFVLLTIASLAIIVILPSFYKLLFPKYLAGVFYSQLLILALPASIFLIPYSALQSQLMDKELYTVSIYCALFQIAITFTFIYFFGLMGAIFSRIISQYMQAILTFYLAFKAK